MSDMSEKPKPGYGPVYAAAMYPQLAEVAQAKGYALCVHGSLHRDFDLVAVPWVEKPATSRAVVDAIKDVFAVCEVGEPETKWHGRECWTLAVGFGECFLDLQFTPTLPVPSNAEVSGRTRSA